MLGIEDFDVVENANLINLGNISNILRYFHGKTQQ